ncbi:hypothetical protein CCMA1212_007473 [Trichoderma ghanense]|uniref:Uncharacterized protein n=1 Tax=Trichoderma ghanense TaxID=65468 RepID=A0ABY2GYH6_9HYPO
MPSKGEVEPLSAGAANRRAIDHAKGGSSTGIEGIARAASGGCDEQGGERRGEERRGKGNTRRRTEDDEEEKKGNAQTGQDRTGQDRTQQSVDDAGQGRDAVRKQLLQDGEPVNAGQRVKRGDVWCKASTVLESAALCC